MNKTILIIEDDPDIMDILEIIFADEGFSTISKPMGANKDEVNLLKPDLILLDIRIAGSDKTGAQICAEFKTTPDIKHIPIVMISAESNLIAVARNCNADGYINKPFDIHKLVGTVKALLS